jgi:Ca2+-binding EF-hand superfamily protein
VNFTKLLQLFGDRLNGMKLSMRYGLDISFWILGTDAEDILMNAFKTFDQDAKGLLNRDK